MMFIWIAILIVSSVFAYKRPRLAAVPVIALLPAYLLRTTLGPLPTTILEAILLGSVAGFFIGTAKKGGLRPQLQKIAKLPYLLPVVLLLVASAIAVFTAPNFLPALGLWRAYFLEPLLAIPLLITTLSDSRSRSVLFRWLAIEAIMISLVALLQVVGWWPTPQTWAAEGRATSLFPFPNAVGLFLGPLIPFFAALGILNGQALARDRWLFNITALFAFAGTAAARSEGALAAALLALLLLSFIANRRGKQIAVGFIALSTALLILSPAIRDNVLEKITFQDWSGTVRRVMWQETVEMLKTRPLLGAGLASYPVVMQDFHRDPKVEIFQYPHNLVLNAWSELGLLGLLAWLWLGAVFLKAMLKNKPDGTAHPAYRQAGLYPAALLALLAMAIHGLVDVPYFKNDLALLTWMFLIIPFAVTEQKTIISSRLIANKK